ncbi:MAG: MopE-related protein, partial [Myxococcota bacterium]|nr:MopE-related protein [Myxococcota bacterium]
MDKQVSVLPLIGVVWLCGLVVSGSWGCTARDDGSGASGKETGLTVDTASDDTGEDQSGDSGGQDSSSVDTGPFDEDGDGVWASEDCDDGNAMVHPGAEEICEDGLDNDCDGSSGECRWSGWEQLSEVSVSVWTGVAAADWAGHAVAMAGDVNGDGAMDFVTSALHESTVGEEAGAIYLVQGPVSEWRSLESADAVLRGVQAGERAGRWVQGRDLDGDGYSDLVTGAALAEASTLSEAGAVYVVSGPVSGELSLAAADVVLSGEQAHDYLGRGLALAGDVDGDGLEDLFVGANGAGEGVPGTGAAYLFLGPFSG